MLGLLDDLEDFVSYDWGELIWIKALGSLKEALRGKVTMHKKKPPNKFPESYSLYGFPFTFQVSNPILACYVFLVICFVIIVLLLMLFLHI